MEETPIRQFSAGFNGTVPGIFRNSRLWLSYGLYYDGGEVLRNGFGALLGIGIKIY